MSDRPLWPEDGTVYYKALAEAAEEYDRWVDGRKMNRGIRVYSRKELDNEASR